MNQGQEPIPARKRGAPKQYPAKVIGKAVELAADPTTTYASIAATVGADPDLWGDTPRRVPPTTTVKAWIDSARAS